MKKFFSFLLVVCMICVFLTACGDNKGPSEDNVGSNNHEESSSEYFVWYNDIRIVGLTEEGKQQTTLVIPENCEKVSSLESSVLQHLSFENPDTEIASHAFSNCTSLKRVELPANLTEIPPGLFVDCTSLETVVIPDGVTSLGYNAFDGCSALKNVTLNEGITVIGSNAFENCISLESIVIPNSVVTIEERAFSGCTSLHSITFSENLAIVQDYAFYECDSLKVIELPESLKTLEQFAFAYCDSLEEIHLNAGIESIHAHSLSQTHNFKVYLTKGSYCDQVFNTLGGQNYMEKIYK